MTYSSAGHPPPLLVGSDGVRWLDEARGTPLAVDGRPRRSATVSLARNDLVVLYSDGLVERRDECIDVGLDRLATAAAELHGQPVHRIADEILRRTLGDERQDDVVLVVKLLDH
jgi:serine phosphatase RsbU (regulator of sigma subunit)